MYEKVVHPPEQSMISFAAFGSHLCDHNALEPIRVQALVTQRHPSPLLTDQRGQRDTANREKNNEDNRTIVSVLAMVVSPSF